MPDIAIKVVGVKELADKFANASVESRAVLFKEITGAQWLLRDAMMRNIKKVLHRRSGGLYRSIAVENAEISGSEIHGRVGSTEPYAEIQERGGTIRAKNHRNLTIPLEGFMTGRGVAKGTAHDVISNPGGYGFDGTFFSKGVLFGKRGEDPAVALFALKPSVTLTAHPWAQPAIEEITPVFEAKMGAGLEALL